MIKTQTYNIKNLYITNEVLSTYISLFWNDIYSKLDVSNKHLMLLLKIQYSEEDLGYKTLGHLRRVNFEDKSAFINYITERIGILHDSYTTLSVSELHFTYIIKEGLASSEDLRMLSDHNVKEVKWHRFNNMNLPSSMKPSDYGRIVKTINNSNSTSLIVSSTSRTYLIDVSLDGLTNEVTILGASDLKWTDTSITGGGFMRVIQKSTIYFLDNKIILRKQQMPAKPFRVLKADKKIHTYFITMDIETVLQNRKHSPYLICAYNGTEYISSFSDNQQELFSSFLKKLLILFKKSKVLKVYAHNLSGFDGVFLMKHLVQFGEVIPLMHNGKIISIKVKLNIENYKDKTIIFKDSYLLLPYGLRQLCDSFGVSTVKSYFPFLLTNIHYLGTFPAFEYWTDVTLEKYGSLKRELGKKIWSFKDESIKYCKLDCKSLHEVLTIYNETVYNKFNINIHSVLTAPALALRVFKTHYMKENTIYQISGYIEKAIRLSYTGGAVDVYIPHNKIGSYMSRQYRKLFAYDVNSLYPAVMANQLMPVGQPIAFEGNIRAIESNAYGFFYCKITSPSFIQYPIIQRKIKTNDGWRTVAGLGTWDGWICSSEMDNAMKYGYTFEIIKGYQFDTEKVFHEYVNTMYELRLSYPKDHPLNLVAKLLMNSLYGKLGMKSQMTKVEIYKIESDEDKQLLKELIELWGYTIKDFVLLGATQHLVIIRDATVNLSNESESYHSVDVNIALASAITAEARILMSLFKNNNNFHLYYSDTDSIVIDSPLPEALVGNKLGQVKLEYVIKKAVFLAPKVYALITEDQNEIVKVKGITQEALTKEGIHYDNLAKLLIQGSSRALTQDKWYKNIMEGTITISDIAYTLKATSNKRLPIYIDGVYEKTIPYNYNQIEK
jgi:DNA polymerase type B, organellar and viral